MLLPVLDKGKDTEGEFDSFIVLRLKTILAASQQQDGG